MEIRYLIKGISAGSLHSLKLGKKVTGHWTTNPCDESIERKVFAGRVYLQLIQ